MNSPLIKQICILLISFLLLFTTTTQAEENPINIAADQMTATEKTNSVTFTGNVDASQGDIRIRSDMMVVYYTAQKTAAKNTKKGADQKQQVEKMTCTGNVEITQGEWLGTADRMDYLERKRQAILSGNAKAWQGKNMVSGSKIIYYLDEGRSEVVAGKSTIDSSGKKQGGRVQMTILQK